MGTVYAEITVKNASDTACAKQGFIKEDQIRSVSVTAIVDTGAMTLIITEGLRQQLGLRIEGLREIKLANFQAVTAGVTEPVEVHWKNRFFIGNAWVLSDWGTPLLGLLPLEYMDLMVDPVNQELVGVHGDKELGMVF